MLRPKAMYLLEANIRRKLCDNGFGNYFLDMTQKGTDNIRKNGQL